MIPMSVATIMTMMNMPAVSVAVRSIIAADIVTEIVPKVSQSGSLNNGIRFFLLFGKFVQTELLKIRK